MSFLATVHPKIYKLNVRTLQIPHVFLQMWTIANIPEGRAICPPPFSLRVNNKTVKTKNGHNKMVKMVKKNFEQSNKIKY